jgi:hypothetical protein
VASSSLGRRRLGTVAMLVAAAILAVVGLLAAPSPAVEKKVTGKVDEPLRPHDRGTPLPVAPPAPPVVPASPPVDPDAPKATEPPPPPASPRAPLAPTPARVAPPPSSPPARSVAKGTPARTPRSSLAVRQDPYVQGFTHPHRLSERRK